MDEITLVEVAALQVLGMKKTGTYQLIPELLMKIYEFTVKKNIPVSGAPLFLCHEITPEAVMEANGKGTATVEVAWPVSGIVKGNREMKVYDLPGGKMVHTVHKDRTSPVNQHIVSSLHGSKHRDSRSPARSEKYIPTIPGS
jgi:effector-binding domain-containing protein